MTDDSVTTPKSVLIIALSGIGNFIMQSPTFAALKKAHPDWRVTVWVAPRGTRALAEGNQHVGDVIEAPIKNGIAGHWQLIKQLRKRKFDIGIVLSPGQLWKGSAYMYLAGIPKRIGNAYPFCGNHESSFLLTDAVPEIEKLHDVEQNLRLLEVIGIKNQESRIKECKFEIPSNFEERAREVLKQLNLTDKLLIGFHAGSAPGFEWKRWPVENFAVVGKTLIEKRQAHILIFGGPDEHALKQALKTQLNNQATIINENLLTTAGIIKHCRHFLSNDSGLMHIAAAVGVPTYGLFGPTDEKKTGPRGPNSFVIRAPGTAPVYDTERNYDVGKSPHKAMLEISPQSVIDMIAKLY